MWNKALAAAARQYADGTLSVAGDSTYPVSVRCTVEVDDALETIVIKTPPALAASWRGAACLLFHRHDAQLENQYQLLIRGDLTAAGSALVLRPTAFVTANGRQDGDRMPHAGAPLQLLRFMLLGQRQARAYLRRRGRPWPKIDFTPMLRALDELPLPT